MTWLNRQELTLICNSRDNHLQEAHPIFAYFKDRNPSLEMHEVIRRLPAVTTASPIGHPRTSNGLDKTSVILK
jgi:hypothetical protein